MHGITPYLNDSSSRGSPIDGRSLVDGLGESSSLRVVFTRVSDEQLFDVCAGISVNAKLLLRQ